jgi:hypothetical protein
MHSKTRHAQTLTKFFTEKTSTDLENPLLITTFSCGEDKSWHSFAQAWIDIEISKLIDLSNRELLVQFVKLLDFSQYNFCDFKSIHLIEKNDVQVKHLVQIDNYFWESEQASQPEKFLYIECDFDYLEQVNKSLQEETDKRNSFICCDSILVQLITVGLSWF